MSDGLPEEDDAAPRVGPQLAAAREARGLSLAEVAAATRIPVRHLHTIESGAYEGLPAPTYSAGFVKVYARLLDLDGQNLADRFRAEAGQTFAPRVPSASDAPADPARTPPRWLAWAMALIAVAAVLGYLYWRGTAESPTELAAKTSDRPAVPAPAPVSPTPTSAVAGPPAIGPVTVSSDQEVWLKIYEEGGATLFMGVMKPGDRFAVPASAIDPRLTTGRPGVTRIMVGASAVPPVGDPDRAATGVSLKADALLARITAAPAAQPPAGAPTPVENIAGPE